ncbi:hypothetical protein AURANDRAFT_67720 [Aureococcus anophagefferens]|uniref:Carrier domain-containing protein n=1 Tax=Aureococcus anophagefferens TaxID=44056 RepID=F0YM59_AURAN|nr:hypothetical protein AURANDRAFT_67720 [Aureococcus anophagefferens]EGB03822.1 hypothetical protein AURANDRAFT_67720 [Aureococcus anophagefferens]|eukprot:XP_009041480.1 hypothetical protein AURANDRAFT_67720 [Aureococcus anophagefferens]
MMPTYASIHGKLLGGGVAFALVADWRACSRKTTLNFGNLPRGVNPLFMLSRALFETLLLQVSICVAAVLGTQVACDTPLMAAGVDSLGATELQRALSREFSAVLSATLLFDHPLIAGIAHYVGQEIQAASLHMGEAACFKMKMCQARTMVAMCVAKDPQFVVVLQGADSVLRLQKGMLSERGRCHSFDARGDGYCRGEGSVSIWLTVDNNPGASPVFIFRVILTDARHEHIKQCFCPCRALGRPFTRKIALFNIMIPECSLSVS